MLIIASRGGIWRDKYDAKLTTTLLKMRLMRDIISIAGQP